VSVAVKKGAIMAAMAARTGPPFHRKEGKAACSGRESGPLKVAPSLAATNNPQMQTLLAITSDEIEDHVAYLRRVSRVVEPSPGIPVVLTDPQDDPIVYTAVTAGADILCARDRSFYMPNVISFCERFGMRVMDEIQLLNRMQS